MASSTTTMTILYLRGKAEGLTVSESIGISSEITLVSFGSSLVSCSYVFSGSDNPKFTSCLLTSDECTSSVCLTYYAGFYSQGSGVYVCFASPIGVDSSIGARSKIGAGSSGAAYPSAGAGS